MRIGFVALALWLCGAWLHAQDFSKMHGAGLTDKQGPGYHPPDKFREADFHFLRENGFNFVRLPIAYQFWTRDDDPALIDEVKVREIDEAVEWGRKYGLHVCLGFYSVPGYSIAEPNRQPSLWTDEKLQAGFVGYWRFFAERYKSVGPELLSFNLLNEPAYEVTEEQYAAVMRQAISAIREIDPRRPIVVDGLQVGRLPVMSLLGENVVQALHFYEPLNFTHAGANLIDGVQQRKGPGQWPIPRITRYLFGPESEQGENDTDDRLKQSMATASPARGYEPLPLLVYGPFDVGVKLRLRIDNVTARRENPLRVVMLADRKMVAEQAYRATSPDNGDLSVTQDIGVDFSGVIPAGTRVVTIRVVAGMGLVWSQLGVSPQDRPDERVIAPDEVQWPTQAAVLRYETDGTLTAHAYYDRQWIWEQTAAKWRSFVEQGGRVMVQEFGCYKETPHLAMLKYLQDCTAVWNGQGWGWAIWELRGPMGILDNQRQDMVVSGTAGEAEAGNTKEPGQAVENPGDSTVDQALLAVLKAAAQDQ
ncbi:MAG: glycoside hydrolase family 5 protein [Verrucomicrobiales bacterium]|jgi:hypothetical protein|nr:glycoside hydrolase family 5 protein [Verrucomicrobiales bacterium]